MVNNGSYMAKRKTACNTPWDKTVAQPSRHNFEQHLQAMIGPFITASALDPA